MLLPTQDNEAKQKIKEAIYYSITPISEIGGEPLMISIDRMVDRILNDIEKLGYYKGLPSGIEQALNSGDGSYRP